MSIHSIQQWHELARPNPTHENFNVQLGCHFEEIAEQLECLEFHSGVDTTFPGSKAHKWIKQLAEDMKSGKSTAVITDRKGFADSVGDQLVTGVGVAHCAGMNAQLIAHAVDSSNWSKYVDGKPVFLPNGKIGKGPNYREPDLTGCY